MTRTDERATNFILRFFNKAYGFKIVETVYDEKYTRHEWSNGKFSYLYTRYGNTEHVFLALYENGFMKTSRGCKDISDIIGAIDIFDIILRKEEN